MSGQLDPHQLLHGPYTPPPLKRGHRAVCRYRDADVVITSGSDGRIPWPRCRIELDALRAEVRRYVRSA